VREREARGRQQVTSPSTSTYTTWLRTVGGADLRRAGRSEGRRALVCGRRSGGGKSPAGWEGGKVFFFFFCTLVTGPKRSLSLKLSDTRVYEPQIRARLGTTAHFCEGEEGVGVREPQRRPEEPCGLGLGVSG